MSYEGGRFESKISLLEDPIKIPNAPNFLTSFVLDRYWQRPTSKWVKRADEIYQKQNSLAEKRGILISGEDKEDIHRYYTIVQNTVQVYNRFVADKNVTQAREVSGIIRENVVRLERIGSESYIRATRMKALADAYLKISERTRPMPLLDASRYAPSCDLCLRVGAVTKVTNWFESNHKRRRILWLRGRPRSGKTVLLRHLARRLDDVNALAASYMFTEEFGTNQHIINHFLVTIMDEISKHTAPFKIALSTVCSKLPNDGIFNKSMRKQVQELLVSGYKLLSEAERRPPLLIALDGLDACNVGGLDALSEFIEQSLSTIPTIFFALASSSSEEGRWVDAMLSKKALLGQVEEVVVDDFEEAKKAYQPLQKRN